jgi:hypothetical protein
MISDEQLAKWRSMGIKSVGFFEGEMYTVEFFPRDLLDVGSIVPEEGAPTDRPPPPGDDVPPMRVAPALAAILKRGSVS